MCIALDMNKFWVDYNTYSKLLARIILKINKACNIFLLSHNLYIVHTLNILMHTDPIQ